MNNEELSDQIAYKHCYKSYKIDNRGQESSYTECKICAMEMATIKDRVIKNQEQTIFACKSDIRQLQIANRNLRSELRNQAKKIRKFKAEKNNDLKNQEQSLLWTLYSILDGLAVEGEARENAINEFKKHLKYYKEL